MKIDKAIPLYIQIKALAKKHKLTKKQSDEWATLCKTAYIIGIDATFKILTTS